MGRFPLLKSAALISATTTIALTAPLARSEDDTVTLRLGVINVDGDIQVKGAANENDNFNYLSKRFDFGKRAVPRLEGAYHFSKRNRILFNYFRYDKNNHFALDRDIDVDGIIISEGDQATATAQLGLGNLIYDYALAETQATSFALQIGAAWAEINGWVKADNGPLIVGGRKSETGLAPVLGARLSRNSADQRWRFSVQGQYVNTAWGNFDTYSGSITRLTGLVEYRFTRHVGLYGGYDWFRLDVDHDFGRLSGGIDLRFMGPTLGLSFAW